MSDNNATERLRKLLDERGVEWKAGLENVTWVGDWCFVEYDNGFLAATCEPLLTPEQAVAATMGKREPTYEQWRAISEAIGDGMEYAHDKAIEYPDKADPLWNLDEYVNRVMEVAFGDAATLGAPTLTAEQVRECTQSVYMEGYSDGSVNRGAHIDETDWQAIADELNAALGADDGTRWSELFGTPERAARFMTDYTNCTHHECDDCTCDDFCCPDFKIGDYDALLEWLRGKAAK